MLLMAATRNCTGSPLSSPEMVWVVLVFPVSSTEVDQLPLERI